MEKKVSRLGKPGPVREAIVVPWRLDSAGRPPNVEVMAEVEAALGTVLGAETPAEWFRGLVSRQGAGAVIAGGSWAGTGRVQHQVHPTEEAGAEAEEEGAAADNAGMELKGVRSGCSRLAGVEQPEGGGKWWWMGRRRYMWRQGWHQTAPPARATRKLQTLGEKVAADDGDVAMF